jgi:hypothetical protein
VGRIVGRTKLYNDLNLLLAGKESVNIVIILNWKKVQPNRVSGTVELFRRGRNGIPRLEQSEVCSKDLINSFHTNS